ncbi:MAG: acetyl-CoA hydrolase/transferase C-terminal domain-containing protein [Pseudomonadota bacterium]
MNFEKEYGKKLVAAAEAVKVVESGDVVDYGYFNGKPVACDQALAARAGELRDVHIYAAVTLPPVPATSQLPGSFVYHDFQYSKLTRLLSLANPEIYYVPVLYHLAPTQLRRGLGGRRKAAFLQVCPMDKNGWFNLGPQNSETKAKTAANEFVIVEVNRNLPVCLGGASEALHISQVDYIVEGHCDQTPYDAPAAAPSEADKKIAALVMEHIKDGSVIQLGIGGLPNAVGRMIAASDLKNLGGHTEMLADAYVDMIESGRMNGSRKSFDRDRVAYTFALGGKRLYEFMDNNPAAASYPVEYTNDPRIIARHDNFVSINNALQVDLYSQVNAESMGAQQISGNGGMWDFVLGAQWSEGGKSFICLSSTFTDKEGCLHSRIVPTFSPGTITTIPRQMVDYLVTDQGMAHMPGLPTWARAEAVIGLAHPDFRDGLVKEAEKQGIWRRSNKK